MKRIDPDFVEFYRTHWPHVVAGLAFARARTPATWRRKRSPGRLRDGTVEFVQNCQWFQFWLGMTSSAARVDRTVAMRFMRAAVARYRAEGMAQMAASTNRMIDDAVNGHPNTLLRFVQINCGNSGY